MFKRIVVATALGAALIGATSTAFAQDAREAEMLGMHQLCDRGDRKACIRFGMMIQQNHDRMEAWRRNHPEWFWWER